MPSCVYVFKDCNKEFKVFNSINGFLLAFAQNFGVWKISSQWQDAIAFIILLVFLLFRPYGFFGKKIRKVEV